MTKAHPDGKPRCDWVGADPLYIDYHDTEWGVPERDDRALFEKLVLDGFQAGLSWYIILKKREAFRRAFDGFRPEVIARYDAKKLARTKKPLAPAHRFANRKRGQPRAVEGAKSAGVCVLRADHRLCLYAGCRHG